MMDMHEELVELLDEVQEYGIENRFVEWLELTDVFDKIGCEKLEKAAYSQSDYEQLISDLIANGVTVQKWISVDERLPEEDGTYLVTINYFGNQNVTIRLFAKDSKTIDDECKWAGQKNLWYFYDGGCGYISTDYVTHWMPLPPAPEDAK